MKKVLPFLILVLTIQHSISAQCNSGSYTVTTNAMITGSCTITGDLTIQNGGILNVDLTGAGADTFVVRGNILLEGNAVLWVHANPGTNGDQFIVSNGFSSQRSITTRDSSWIRLEHIEFRTQEGDLTNKASIYMGYDAEDRSTFYTNKSWLDGQKAWLLCNMKENSTLIGDNPKSVPTEIYLQDTAQVIINGPDTQTMIWLNFQSITDTLDLPPDQTQPFTWKVGRGFGGVNIPWYLELDTAKSEIGVQILPSANMVINGSGLPATGELKVGLYFANGTDTLNNLHVGLQNITVPIGSYGSVKLNNVNLGPVAWQVYVMMNENLHIKNSVVNEIGVMMSPSNVTVDSSLLQFAVLAAVGLGGTTMTINNSKIWNQAITASNYGSITLNNCEVYGSAFSTTDTFSTITVNGGCFFPNPSDCGPPINTILNISTGQPNCNPFIPPGPPQNLSPATVTFNDVNQNCTAGINNAQINKNITVFPNPSSGIVQINLPEQNQNFHIEVYSPLGQQLLTTSDKTVIDISGFATGIYILIVKQDNKIWTSKLFKQ